MRSRLLSVTLVTVLVLLLGACSSVRLGYASLPSFLAWRIDRDLALDGAQRALVGEHLDSLASWHRASELPRYAAFLSGIAAAPAPVSEATVAGWRTRALEDAWRPIAEKAALPVAALALTLRPEQLDRLARRFAERNDELKREWGLAANGIALAGGRQAADGGQARADAQAPGDPRALVDARVERFRGRAEFFLGELQKPQLDTLRALAAAHPPYEADWMAEREARQRQAIAVLGAIAREQPPIEVAEARVRDWLLAVWKVDDPARAARLAEASAATDRLSAALLPSAAPLQRETMTRRLRGWAQDLAAMAAR